jgi:ribosomal protein S18 acetylase RimI-like enzyme
MKIYFCKATIEDAFFLAEIHVLSWQKAYVGIIPDTILSKLSIPQKEAYFDNVLRTQKETIFCIKKQETIIGFIVLGACRDRDLSIYCGEIWAIYMHPDLWNQGAGTKAIRHSFDILKREGYTNCSLWVLKENTSAISFYKKEGFEFLDFRILNLGGKELIENRYIKKL